MAHGGCGTLATIVAAVYYMLTIQRVCLERSDLQVTLAPGPQLALPLAFVLTALTVLISLWPAPFVQFAAEFAGVTSTSGVPQFETPWTLPVLVPYLGGFAIYVARPAIGAPARCSCGAARDCNRRSRGARREPRSSLQAVRDPVRRHRRTDDPLFDWLYRARRIANRYYFFAFLMTGSLIGLTTAHEFGNFYVFWELMTWTSYFLVVHEQTPKALRAGLVYFLMCAAGAYVMHFGILLAACANGLVRIRSAGRKGRNNSAAGWDGYRCLLLHRLRGEDGPRAATKLAAARPPRSTVVDFRPAVGHSHQGRPVRHGEGVLRDVRRSRADTLRLRRCRCHRVLMVLGCLTLIYGEIRALLSPN